MSQCILSERNTRELRDRNLSVKKLMFSVRMHWDAFAFITLRRIKVVVWDLGGIFS